MDALKSRLTRVYRTFFGRFPKPNDVQQAAMPPILDGRDVLLCAPTASGKTEAFAAPLAEAALAERGSGRRAIVVSPTRALANDLLRRLEERFDVLGIELGRYTGEHKERGRGGLSEVTITTPEALDSLLARRRHLLRSVRAVVCDEIHVLDGRPRGDQLRILLHRLEYAAEHRPQRIAVSATVDDPQGVNSRYLKDGVVVQLNDARPIRRKSFAGRGPLAIAGHLEKLARHGFRKVLVFCNRRADVEDLSGKLRGHCAFGDAVFGHHGSLSQSQRERTERQFLEAPAAVAFATMTLELGIDIGSVDYVLLAGPPPDVASLLQRTGRGSRRTGEARVGFAVDDPGEALVCDVLVREGQRRRLLAAPYSLRPGVVAQQAVVLAGSREWVDAPLLQQNVPPDVWKEVAPFGAPEILESLYEAEVFEAPRAGRFVLAERWESDYRSGKLHSNIDSDPSLEIVDRLTGEVIGNIGPMDQRKLTLAGGGRKVVKQVGGRLLTDATPERLPTQFAPRGRPCCSFRQARAVVEACGVEEGKVVRWSRAEGTWFVHGLGTLGALLLEKEIARQHKRGALVDSSPYVLKAAIPLDELPVLAEEAVHRFVRDYEKKLALVLAMGPWHRHLPEGLRKLAVERASELEEVLSFLRRAGVECWVGDGGRGKVEAEERERVKERERQEERGGEREEETRRKPDGVGGAREALEWL